tara:strand:+ start:812 stop:1894 length:1083 start_codon:yes stop_codon:yes gene_type:complete
MLNKIFGKAFHIKDDNNFEPKISIIVSAYNEMDVIGNRIQNLIDLSYPKNKIEIIIGSDGSDDQTVLNAKKHQDERIKIIDFPLNRGKALTQNDLISSAKNEICILTDADSIFEKDFVKNIVEPFKNKKVGCVVGNLVYKNKNEEMTISGIEKSFYNNWDIKLREYESNLGILANGTGAAMAIRKNLFNPLQPVDDTDTRTVIDICLKKQKVIFAKKAIAFDIPPQTHKNIIQARSRSTSKTLKSIFHDIKIIDWLKNLKIFFSVFSHRILRYMTPIFLLSLFISNIFLIDENTLFLISFFIQISFYSFSIIGYFWERSGHKTIKIFSSINVFFLTMIGILSGLIKIITGNIPVTHKLDD